MSSMLSTITNQRPISVAISAISAVKTLLIFPILFFTFWSFGLSGIDETNAAPFDATNFMTLFFHSRDNDSNSAYNTLSLTPPEATACNTVGSAATAVIC